MKIEEINNGNLNKVYKISINDNKYIIRASTFDNNFECAILNILEKNNMSTPKLKTNFMFENTYVMVYKYIEGTNPTYFDENFFENLINQLKRLHNIKFDFEKENINDENFEKLKKYYDIAIKSEYLQNDLEFINNVFFDIRNNLNIHDLPKSIVHSDIKKENIIINNDDIYFIDFGNCYIGNRIVDIIRILMWFFIKYENYDKKEMIKIIKNYFDDNNKITDIEFANLELLLKFCLLYNFLKDIYLLENGNLKKEYIEKNSLKWLKALKDEQNLQKVLGVLKNAKRFAK